MTTASFPAPSTSQAPWQATANTGAAPLPGLPKPPFRLMHWCSVAPFNPACLQAILSPPVIKS